MSQTPRFHFLRGSPAERPSGFELGHVRVTLGAEQATSEGRRPDQAFMLYITASELADQARAMLLDRRRSAEVIATDSSFRLAFWRRRPEALELHVGGRRLGCTSPLELAQAIASGVEALLAEGPLDDGDPVAGDVRSALAELRGVIDRGAVGPTKRPRNGPMRPA